MHKGETGSSIAVYISAGGGIYKCASAANGKPKIDAKLMVLIIRPVEDDDDAAAAAVRFLFRRFSVCVHVCRVSAGEGMNNRLRGLTCAVGRFNPSRKVREIRARTWD